METTIWSECENAYDVLQVMLRRRDEDTEDYTDAPAWGEIPVDLASVRSRRTVWSWDADGIVIGFDGSLSEDQPGVYLTWEQLRAELT